MGITEFSKSGAELLALLAGVEKTGKFDFGDIGDNFFELVYIDKKQSVMLGRWIIRIGGLHGILGEVAEVEIAADP